MAKIANLEHIALRPSAIKESWDAESIWSPVVPSFLVRVIAEDGTVGVGEATSQVWYLGETAAQIASVLDLYRTRLIGVDATNSTMDPAIVAGTVIYLNTDQNNTTGFSPFGNVGAEYEVQFAIDTTTNTLQAYLYSVTAAGVTTVLALDHPDSLIGIHITTLESDIAPSVDDTALSDAEQVRNSRDRRNLRRVETTGIEPATSWLQTRRSPN